MWENNSHKTGRKVTCVSGHPEDECVAIGDVSGRVQVLKDLLQTNTVRGTYHWHTLPVTEIAFSKSGKIFFFSMCLYAYHNLDCNMQFIFSGGNMYTGGGECVLVKWLLTNPQNKSFLPRLQAPIRHLVVAPENVYVAVSTFDNGKLFFKYIFRYILINTNSNSHFILYFRYYSCKSTKKIDSSFTKFHVGRS